MPKIRLLTAVAAALLLADIARAGPVTPYTDFDAFQLAIAGLGTEQVEGFDAVTAPVDIPEGTAFGGYTFSGYDLAGAVPRIVERTGETSSNDNALETDQGTFVGGDGFTITAAGLLRAFGLFIVTGDDLADGDVRLLIGGDEVLLNAADAITGPRLWTEFDFDPGTSARLYFLGAVATSGFGEIVLSSSDAASFSFGIDDLRSVPVPPVWALLLLGVGGLVRRRRADVI